MHLVINFIDLNFLIFSKSAFKASYFLDQGDDLSLENIFVILISIERGEKSVL